MPGKIHSTMKSFSVLLIVFLLLTGPVFSQYEAGGDYEYAGLEYFGASQLTGAEINKMLHLRPGASMKSIEKAVKRLEEKIHKLRLFANVQIVTASNNRAYVAVDLIEQSDDLIPVRKLSNPHHVTTKSEKPNILFNRLKARLTKLNQEGRAWKTVFKGGYKYFSDEPANQIVTDIRRFAPAMKDDWLEVIASDPDPERRVEAIELLNWSGNFADTCYRLIGAIDDSNFRVRASAVRFIYDRLDLLPFDFPYEDLMHALLRQVKRPSHEDRVKSLYMMYAILNKQPLLTAMAKESCGKEVKVYAEQSIIPSVRKIAERLNTKFSQPLPRKIIRKAKPDAPGF